MVDQDGDLAEYFARRADIAGDAEVPDLTTLAREVKTVTVKGLLLARAPKALNVDGGADFESYLALLNGVSTEVGSIVGEDPSQPVRRLALWAIALGTAADIEDALFPEQQLGGSDGTGSRIRARYLAILTQLRGMPGVADADGALGVTAPLGSFPAPLPDPFRGTLPVRGPVYGYDEAYRW